MTTCDVTDNSPNSALAVFLRSKGAEVLAESVMRYPVAVASAAELVGLSGCTVAAAASAISFFTSDHGGAPSLNTSSQVAAADLLPHSGALLPAEEDQHHKLLQRCIKDLKGECLRLGLLSHGSKHDLAMRLVRFRQRQTEAGRPVAEPASSAKVDPLRYMKRSPKGAPATVQVAAVTFSVLCDSRERAHKHQHVIDAFVKAGIPATTIVLPAGDFWLQHGVTGKLLPVVIERKTINDLLHSVVTARYNDQKRVLFRSPFLEVVYLVEGSVDALSDEERRRVLSACLTTSLADGFTVVRTTSLDESVAFISRLGRRLASQGGASATLEACETSCQELHDSLQLASLPQRMLCHVHGCSARLVSELSLHCRSIHELFETLALANRDADFSGASKPLKKLLVFLADFLGANRYS
jgi:ERCC4-type nuclease